MENQKILEYISHLEKFEKVSFSRKGTKARSAHLNRLKAGVKRENSLKKLKRELRKLG